MEIGLTLPPSMYPGKGQYTSSHMGVTPVQFPKSHLVVLVEPLRMNPSLHWYNPRPPCRVLGTCKMEHFIPKVLLLCK